MVKKKRKAKTAVKRTRHPVTRRRAIGTLAAGAGALLVARSGFGAPTSELDENLGQWVSWEDGWAYRITGLTADGAWWVVEFDDGEFAVDPAGWVSDSQVWYPIIETDSEGVWFSGDDGYDYLLEHDLEYVTVLVNV